MPLGRDVKPAAFDGTAFTLTEEAMQLEKKTLAQLIRALDVLDDGFSDLPDPDDDTDTGNIEAILLQAARAMQDNYPYHHPLYAGQMLKPPHPVARMAYALSLWINPNNHALDGGRASSRMEKEAVAQLAGLFGWGSFLGHLTGGGTMANLEALWIAGRIHPGRKIVASRQAHYTHQRISEVLGLCFQPIECDGQAKLDLDELEKELDSGQIGTVVATIGTTGCGSVDPLPQILRLKERYGFRLHADAAYGGYYTLCDHLDKETAEAYAHLPAVDSIVIDPHKHGLQPYGCGSVLFRDPAVGKFYKHDSPYTYFSSAELHLGEISLECSRPGAAAVALWATQKMFPLVRDGEFAAGLNACRRAALGLYAKIRADHRFLTLFPPDLDIVVWAPAGDTASSISQKTTLFFEEAANADLHLATFSYPSGKLRELWPGVEFDQDQVRLLRSCLMKPEHERWMDRIWAIINRVADGLKEQVF